MKHIISILVTLATCLLAFQGLPTLAQYTLSVEAVAEHEGLVGTEDLTGYTTYRVYLETEHPTDFVSAVFGDQFLPLSLEVTGGDIYNCEYAMGATADGINPAFYPFFPQLQFDSWVTIGIDQTPTGSQTSISSIQSNDEPWGSSFAASGAEITSVSLSSASGGVWYVLNTSPNGIAGPEQRVLLAQITTNGTLSGTLNVQVFPEGNGQEEFVLSQSFEGTAVHPLDSGTLPADCPGAFNCVVEGDGSTVCDYPFFFNVDESQYFGSSVLTLDELTADAGTIPSGIPDGNLSTKFGILNAGTVASMLSFYTPNDPASLTNVSGTSFTVNAGFAPDGAGGMTTDASWSAFMHLDLGPYSYTEVSVVALLDFDPAVGNPSSTYHAFDVSGSLIADASIDADSVYSYMAALTWSDAQWAATGDTAVTDFAPFLPAAGGEYGFKIAMYNLCDELVMEHEVVLTSVASGEGCMTLGACNYDPAATIPGDCDYFSCLGCTDQTACNYDPAALYNDGSCEFNSCLQYGCTFDTACNFDPEATLNDGSCDFSSCVGCMNPDATNFDPDATIDSGQCTIPGCVISTACNYNPEATVSDGSCEFGSCTGCMNATACNYDASATLPDASSCVFPATHYDCEGLCLADSDGDGICDPLEIAGCTDPAATNYNPAATDDDGSCGDDGLGCVIPSACNYDPTANVNDGSCEFSSCLGCMNEAACNFDETATLSDATLCDFPDAGYDCAGVCLEDGDGDGVCDPFEILGCTDPLANNFDAGATESNGSCTYDPVCNDPLACNYDANWGYCIQVDTVAVHEGMVGDVDLTGFSTYRLYALCQNADDFVSGVFGDDNAPTIITSSTDFFQSPFGDGLATGINPALMSFFPSIAYDSWVTIGVEQQTDAAAGEGPINVIAGPSNPWLTNFENGSNLIIDDATGGGWFNLQGYTNGIAGDDLRVLLGQFTTDGTLDGELFVQFFKYSDSGIQEVTISADIGGACSFPQFDGCEFPEEGLACDGSCLEDADGDGICDANEIVGCLDATACNYEPTSTDEGECIYAELGYNCAGTCLQDSDGDGVCNAFEVDGCMDTMACNFDSLATDNDGSCEYPTPGYDCSGACLLDADSDGVCDWLEVVGCQDVGACNFDPMATDSGDCSYPDMGYDCDGNCLSDNDLDGVCDEFEVLGCTDSAACNFDDAATDSSDDCAYPDAGYACDGSCLQDSDMDGVCDPFEIEGCTDPSALNYEDGATEDDGSCEYPVDPCAPDLTPPAFTFVPADSTVTCDQDMPTLMAMAMDECDEEVEVTFVDGPIEYTLPCAPFNYLCTRTFTATDAAGNSAFAIQMITVVDTIGPAFAFAMEANLTVDEALGQSLPNPAAFVEDACDLTATWTSSDDVISTDAQSTWIERTYTATDACGNETVFVQTITVLHAEEGCTDELACNFDSAADLDDSSCVYAESGYDCSGSCLEDSDGDGVCDAFEVVGCIAENACDYNPAATDEGACDFCSCNGEAPAYGLEIEVVAEHADGLLAGMTTYRMYATLEHADDFVSSVFGNSEDTLILGTTTSFYQHPGGSALGQSINPVVIASFPELAYDSWVTIGLDQLAGFGEGEVQTVQGASAWSNEFENGNDIVMNDELGGLWFILNGSTNGVAGDDLRVLIAQVTTDGELSGMLNMQVFVHGVGANELRYPLVFEDGEWSFDPIENACGCTDETASNFDAEAVYDDGTCAEPVVGCMDETACNFDAAATLDDASCIYPEAEYDCFGSCLEDADADGVCDAFEVAGCTDPEALNYASEATDDDGSCEFIIPGCLDPLACNFMADANEEDGSCVYAEPELDCNGACLEDTDGDGVCDAFEVLGCTDPMAENYDPIATDDDGSCYTCDLMVSESSSLDATCFDTADGAFTLQLEGSALPSFTWSPAIGQSNGLVVTGLSQGIYVVSAVDTLGCTSEVEVAIGSPEPILVDAVVSDIYCNGGENGAIQIMANGGDGNFQFAFDCINFSEEDTFVGLVAGEYAICVEDGQGCTASWFGEVVSPDAIEISIESVIADVNGEGTGSIDVTVVGGEPDYTFQWTGLDGQFQSDQEDLSGLASGTYSLTVTDGNGCTATLDAVMIEAVGVVEHAAMTWSVYPNPTPGQFQIELPGDHSFVDLTVYDGAGRVVWSESSATWSGSQACDLSDLPAGWYVVMAKTLTGRLHENLLIQR